MTCWATQKNGGHMLCHWTKHRAAIWLLGYHLPLGKTWNNLHPNTYSMPKKEGELKPSWFATIDIHVSTSSMTKHH